MGGGDAGIEGNGGICCNEDDLDERGELPVEGEPERSEDWDDRCLANGRTGGESTALSSASSSGTVEREECNCAVGERVGGGDCCW